jgi:GTP pyrophosphokinase
MSDMLVHFGKCCNPLPGDPIVGYVTRGRGVSIHVADCPKVVGLDPARRIDVSWDVADGALSEATIRVVCVDRPGLLASITDAITNQGVNISAAAVRTTEDKTAVNTFELQIKDVGQLRSVIKSLERLKGIISVERLRQG